MAKAKQPEAKVVTINGTQYDANKFSKDQLIFFKQCVDLDVKIQTHQLELQQLEMSKAGFINALTESLVDSEAKIAE